ncbi:MAG: class I SAM-dependent RNA methyltransferase [Flavobacteriales bacterium]|nr:class I SAM-dependent RNA methyltransferase [Flavobacteriales bacterium]
MLAKTSFGLEEVLAKELRDLGVNELSIINRAVSFTGDLEMLYKANIWLRTANRILLPIHQFRISSIDDLYNQCKKIAWEDYFGVDQSFAIDATVFSKLFKHTQFAAYRSKDAIADRFRDRFGKRPNVEKDHPDVRINIHIDTLNQVTISLDSSGDPLFKRGYRDSRSIAPLKEDLAAGLILLSEWDKNSHFVDLFCGSGTLLIEAALIANNIPPNINRAVFGFMNWKNFDEKLFDQVVEEALNQEVDFKYDIIGIEIDGRVMGMSRANIQAAGLTDKIRLFKRDFKDFKPPHGDGIIVSNPPYGERIGENVDDLYKQLGDTFKERYDGWSGWIISSNMEALKKVGLRPSRKIKLYNGSLECRFMKYDMYKGTKKIHKLQDPDSK